MPTWNRFLLAFWFVDWDFPFIIAWHDWHSWGSSIVSEAYVDFFFVFFDLLKYLVCICNNASCYLAFCKTTLNTMHYFSIYALICVGSIIFKIMKLCALFDIYAFCQAYFLVLELDWFILICCQFANIAWLEHLIMSILFFAIFLWYSIIFVALLLLE